MPSIGFLPDKGRRVTKRGAPGGKLGAEVAARIGRRVVAGELAPGATLPTEAELCASFGVSRTTIRDALKRLQGKGLVAGATRAGTWVLPTSRWSQFDGDILAWRLGEGLDCGLLRELYEMRSALEPEACRRAAEHASDEDNERIGRAFAAITALRTQPAELIEADLAFHLAIVDATHNRFFIAMGPALRTALRVSFSLLQGRPDLPVEELDLHGTIARAIAVRDGEEAARIMQRLISLSQGNVADSIGPEPARSAAPRTAAA
jgi:GntR family galactonate operon transcriptional repressor